MTLEEKRLRGVEATRRWRARNPIKLAEIARRRAANPPPSTPEQRAQRRKTWLRWRDRNPGKHTINDPTYRQRAPWTRSLGTRQAHAKKRGIPFTLKVADARAVWTGKCAVTGLPFDMRTGLGLGPRPFSPSMDRLSPKKGYVPGNIRFVLQCVNAFRGTMKDRLMECVAAKIVERGTLRQAGSQTDKVKTSARR